MQRYSISFKTGTNLCAVMTLGRMKISKVPLPLLRNVASSKSFSFVAITLRELKSREYFFSVSVETEEREKNFRQRKKENSCNNVGSSKFTALDTRGYTHVRTACMGTGRDEDAPAAWIIRLQRGLRRNKEKEGERCKR